MMADDTVLQSYKCSCDWYMFEMIGESTRPKEEFFAYYSSRNGRITVEEYDITSYHLISLFMSLHNIVSFL